MLGRWPVEAWLNLPGWLRVVMPDGRERIETGVLPTRTTMIVTLTVAMAAGRPASTVGRRSPAWRLPHEVEPPSRDDGLVAERPEYVDYDDPLRRSCNRVALRHPVELRNDVAELAVSAAHPVFPLVETAVGGRRFGFASKLRIHHPWQVKTFLKAFRPSEADVAWHGRSWTRSRGATGWRAGRRRSAVRWSTSQWSTATSSLRLKGTDQ